MHRNGEPTQIAVPADLADALALVAAERHTTVETEAMQAIEAHVRSARIRAEVSLLTDDELDARLAGLDDLGGRHREDREDDER